MPVRLGKLYKRAVPAVILCVPFLLTVPLLALGTSFWDGRRLFSDALPTASYPSSLVAFAVAILGGHAVAALATGGLWAWVMGDEAVDGVSDEPVTPAVVGALERALYVYALYLGVMELIAIWLALKAVGRWQTTERTHFNVFLVGTLLSLVFGLAGAAIVAGNPLR
jgi:hypothetical protein